VDRATSQLEGAAAYGAAVDVATEHAGYLV
jgi:hypothetical protein